MTDPTQTPTPTPTPTSAADAGTADAARLAADAAARESALDGARSFLVQAPAGSGKTTLLTQRLLLLLARVQEPEEVLAITFTRKAAAEMRHRVLAALTEAAAGLPVEDEHKARTRALALAVLTHDASRGWNLLADPGRLRVLTFDALCLWLAGRLPVVSGTGAVPTVQPDATPLYARAASRTLARLDDGDAVADAVAAVLAWCGNDLARLEGLIVALLARRDHWLRHAPPGQFAAEPARVRAVLEASLAALVSDGLAEACERLPAASRAALLTHLRVAARHLPPPDALPDAPADGHSGDWCRLLESAADLEADPATLPLWRAAAAFALTQSGTVRKSLDKRNGFPTAKDGGSAEAKAAAKGFLDGLTGRPREAAALAEVQRLPVTRYSEPQWQALRSIVVMLGAAASELELVFAEAGAVDYVAVARAALTALGPDDEPTDLALGLDYRLSHLLVDEFQDTSAAQVALLERLTAGFSPGDGRTVFLVGDPMQSIYRFREADVGLFLRVRDRGLGELKPEALVLEANFRSAPPLVDWVNRVFAAAFPAEDALPAGGVRHRRATAGRRRLDGVAPRLHPLPAASAAAEGEAVARFVAARRAERPDWRIAVLARSRTQLTPVASALSALGCPFQGVDLIRLRERLAVRDLVALTRAVCHLADRDAWLACLRAPHTGLSLGELHTLVSGAPEATVLELTQDPVRLAALPAGAAARLRRAVAALEAARADRGRRPLAEVVEGLWLALGGPATLSDPADLVNVEAFLRELARLAPAGDLPDPVTLLDDLERLYAAPDPAADDRLQLMTVHHAKGLEWDLVVLTGLNRTVRRSGAELLRWVDWERPNGGRCLVLAPLKNRDAGAASPEPVGEWLKHLNEVREQHEAKRLLYVACTRAIRELHLFGHQPLTADDDGTPTPAAPAAGTPLALLGPPVGNDWAAAGARVLLDRPPVPAPADATPRTIYPPGERLADDWRAPATDPGLPVSRAESRSPALPEFVWVQEPARQAGLRVHEELARRAADPNAAYDAKRTRRLLREAGLHGVDLDEALARTAAALARVLADPRGRWILDPGHRAAAAELALTGLDRGAVVSVVIDRTFVDRDGVRWVIDYKTSTHEGAGRDEFLDAEVERYRAQLERYGRLMRAYDPGHPVRLGLYFPLLQGWREWQPA